MRGPMEPSGRTLIQRAISILRRYGQDAHIYLPGVGMLNGLQAGNYLDSALTTPAAIDNPVGGVVDAIGGINASQPTTASKPILRRDAGGRYYWQFDGSNDSLSLGGPLFQMADDHCVVLCASRNSVGGERYPFMSSGVGAVALSPAIAFASDGIIKAYWRGDDNILKTANTATSYTPNTPAVVTASKIGNSKKARVNAGAWASNTDAIGAASITGVAIGSRIDGATPIDGNIYPVIAIKGTVSDPDLLLLEKFVGQLSGVQI